MWAIGKPPPPRLPSHSAPFAPNRIATTISLPPPNHPGQKEIKEPAEELRKAMMDQVEQVIGLAQRDLSVYIDELTQVTCNWIALW